MSRLLYQIALLIARPLVHVRLKLRTRKEPEYGERKQERFGYVPDKVRSGPVWFHTVSAGETIAAAPLIRELTALYPEQPFLVTTMTPTGSHQVTERLSDVVDHCYAPYDFKDAVQRFFHSVQPKILLLMETELWPGMIAAADAAGIEVIVVNARLSERSAKGYQKLGNLTRTMMQSISHIACQTSAHRDRFIGLGAAPTSVTVTGSVKYDISLSPEHDAKVAALRERFALHATDPVWIAASTHPGEDELVLNAHVQMQELIPDLRLILVPRHPVRCDEVADMVRAAGFTVARQSQEDLSDTKAQVIIGDVMGQLQVLYDTARVAYVGGSLVDVGGHNPIEPALCGLPVVCGPFQYNFTDVMDAMAKAGGLTTVTSADDLCRTVSGWLQNEEARQAAGQAALANVEANRGAQARIRELVTAAIDRAIA